MQKRFNPLTTTNMGALGNAFAIKPLHLDELINVFTRLAK
jgi:hypothetical protein